ncbi:histone chaperone domain CHZ-domain-containing protein [Echria macrotheca]|uniref:Histone chaperone domain CHZ-domain-containing protein n=1 Tax=Echria macrotheca TaxID=438768 RepID=A0AAJ0B1P2_9PEZI|nr:histone chaperone domain CHZ-domain-containing protein [Echria macrotheca]
MATENGTTTSVQDPAALAQGAPVETKGKGKAAATAADVEDTSMAIDDDDEDDDDEEEADEEEAEAAADEEDGMEEIDLDNVIGRRTRGKVIDFAKAAEENPADDDEDEDDDEDFEVEDETMNDA